MAVAITVSLAVIAGTIVLSVDISVDISVESGDTQETPKRDHSYTSLKQTEKLEPKQSKVTIET